MNKKIFLFLSIVVVFIGTAAFILFRNTAIFQANGKELSSVKVEGNTVTVNLVAKETQQELSSGVKMPVWTYGGTVPGKEIRVKQGQDVVINFKNELPVNTTIHWHGYPVPFDQDGVPGSSQPTIKPGETFTYKFNAKVAGTYWYHSHEDSANQLGKGLSGALIVEKKEENNKPAQDVTVMLNEWVKPQSDQMGGMDHSQMGGMAGMDHSNMSAQDMANMDHMAMYNLFTINGKSGTLIDPLKVKTGEKVRLRFINAGYQVRVMDFGNLTYKVVATDGQDIPNPGDIKGKVLPIAAGERYDVEFTVPSTSFMIYDRTPRPAAKDVKFPVQNQDNTQFAKEVVNKEEFDLTQYGVMQKGEAKKYNKEYKLVFEDVMDPSSDMGMKYTINGKSFPDVPNIKVDKGDTVKITYVNKGQANHPMHLHGHTFKVLTKNGKPVADGIYKDTLLVKPNETYEVEFVANNPGDWMYHCHDLHHASTGMALMVEYNGFQSPVKGEQHSMKE